MLDTLVENRGLRECQIQAHQIGVSHVDHRAAHHARSLRRLWTVLQLKNIDSRITWQIIGERIDDRVVVRGHTVLRERMHDIGDIATVTHAYAVGEVALDYSEPV